ncbi:lantibiotic dehydratase [Kitasatospora sp. NPDC058032]|uniref:lantibiotic dehydratase n=1 Tax=Kitasatospora sp. NPDC058032 TaxID=3346307 RepID=UPI0036D9F140
MPSAQAATAGFRTASQTLLLRAAAHGPLELPPRPDPLRSGPAACEAWRAWLRGVWTIEAVADALGHASPDLRRQVQALLAVGEPGERALRRAGLSTARYLARLTGRATPSGLFAGVAAARFGERTQVVWGPDDRAVARADAHWLAQVVDRLECDPAVLQALTVVANSTLTVRGDRLIVPYQPHRTGQGTGAVEVSIRLTAPVRAALASAKTPIGFADLVGEVGADLPDAPVPKIEAMLAELVARGALVTGLRAPSTEPDALAHMLRALKPATRADPELVAALTRISGLLDSHQRLPAGRSGPLREQAASAMPGLAEVRRHPVAVDLRLDVRAVLPNAVAQEAERAAHLLARLSPAPYGSRVWADYHQRFYCRFGSGALVPLLEVVADSGIGWPAGYPGTTDGPAPGRRSRRNELLLALAQEAALEGRTEVVLDERLITDLEQSGPGPVRLPRGVELCARVDATSPQALDRGDFRLAVTSVSRAPATVTGRFLHLLDPADREALTAGITGETDPGTLCAQLSFPPLDPATAHVARALRTLPAVISLAEHHDPGADVLTAADLAMGCDSVGLYLAAPGRGVRVEAWPLHALNPHRHTPPLARLITELSHAHTAQVTDFDWGTARTLPFLPRVRAGRTVLAPATWRLNRTDLASSGADFDEWCKQLESWRGRRRAPGRLLLVDGDRRLPLDLDAAGDRALLHDHLRRGPLAVLEEAPAGGSAGWCGGRAHEIVVPLTSHRPAAGRKPARPRVEQVVHPGVHGHSPGASTIMLASLYGHAGRQDTVLTEHLPRLLGRSGTGTTWWFVRFRDSQGDCLRLRIALPNAGAFGATADRIGVWADELRRQGLLREVVHSTSWPDTGRWGASAAWASAHYLQAADSRLVLDQLRQATGIERQVLVAANFTAITAAFTGSTAAGTRWLINHVPPTAPQPVPRSLLRSAQQMADPHADFAALRRVPGGSAIVDRWADRTWAITDYRAYLDGPFGHGVDPHAALGAVLHTHFLRAIGIDPKDKAVCLYLARAAALAHTTRVGDDR